MNTVNFHGISIPLSPLVVITGDYESLLTNEEIEPLYESATLYFYISEDPYKQRLAARWVSFATNKGIDIGDKSLIYFTNNASFFLKELQILTLLGQYPHLLERVNRENEMFNRDRKFSFSAINPRETLHPDKVSLYELDSEGLRFIPRDDRGWVSSPVDELIFAQNCAMDCINANLDCENES